MEKLSNAKIEELEKYASGEWVSQSSETVKNMAKELLSTHQKLAETITTANAMIDCRIELEETRQKLEQAKKYADNLHFAVNNAAKHMNEKILELQEANKQLDQARQRIAEWEVKETERVDLVTKLTNTRNIEFLCAEYERARQCIAELENSWIPVAERLPEEWVKVLVVTDYGGMDVCIRSGEGAGMWINEMRPQHTDGSVTHWVPLPLPPKEGQE